VRHEKDLEDIIPLKVLVGIPHLELPGEKRSRVLFRRMEFGAAVLMVSVVVAGTLFAFYKS
jgi:hypothetical protein